MIILCYRASILGGLYGAIGVPYEFKSRDQVGDISLITMCGSGKGFVKTYQSVPYGTWSDDSSSILCLLDSILSGSGDHGFILNMIRWRNDGLYAVDGIKFDIGEHTAYVLSLWEDEYDMYGGSLSIDRVSSLLCDDRNYNGNGSLMRMIGLVLPYVGSLTISCCRIYVMVCWMVYHHSSYSFVECIDYVYSVVGGEYVEQIRCYSKLSGSGYVVDSLLTVFDCVISTDNYRDAILRAISYGNDSDTTACIVGGLVGLRYGVEGIPDDWLVQLRGRDILDVMIGRLGV